MATTLINQSDITRIYGAGMVSFSSVSYRILASPSNDTQAIYECFSPYRSIYFISIDKVFKM